MEDTLQPWTSGGNSPPNPRAQWVIRADAVDSPGFKRQQAEDGIGWPHSRPGSTLIAAMGNHWAPGSWQHVMDMMKFTLDRGYHVEFQEIQDRCFEYADGLGTMRNEAAQCAATRGVEWVLLVENEVWPPEDALVRLLEWHPRTRANLLVPYVVEFGTGMPLHGPDVGPNNGFRWVKWSVLSFLLVKMCVFARYPSDFWRDAIGADEGYHFQKLARDGVYLGMDTGLQVPVVRRPQYPLATNTLSDEERRRHWDWRNKQRAQVPDRRPIDPEDKRVDANGFYNPFIKLPEAKPAEDVKDADG